MVAESIGLTCLVVASSSRIKVDRRRPSSRLDSQCAIGMSLDRLLVAAFARTPSSNTSQSQLICSFSTLSIGGARPSAWSARDGAFEVSKPRAIERSVSITTDRDATADGPAFNL